MNRPAPRNRKRAFLEVTVGPVHGTAGGGRSWSVPFEPQPGQQVVLKFHKAEADHEGAGGLSTQLGDPAGSAGSEASTIPAFSGGPPHEAPECGAPLEFQQFQQVYEQWNEGQLSNDEVKQQFGMDTLELLETQKIVLVGESCRGQAARNGSSMDAVSRLEGEGNVVMSGGSLMALTDEHKLCEMKEANECTDTLLDEMLATCKSSTEAD